MPPAPAPDGPGAPEEASATARRWGVSTEAVALTRSARAVDLHVESFIWTRLVGYDLARPHRHPPGRGWLGGQSDVPRMVEAGLGDAVMSVATNPFRRHRARRRLVRANVVRLTAELERAGAEVVADADAADRATATGRLACWVGLQGGNALDPADLAHPDLAVVSRVTLVHLTRSRLGAPSAPGGGGGGLRPAGRALVEALRHHHVLLDLAHASPATFRDALDVHGRGPMLVSHTGVQGARRSWRNLDDEQIRAVGARAGVVGIMAHRGFLARPGWRARAVDVVRHLDHVERVAGAGVAALGSDHDGFIVPPRDLRSVDALPRLVQAMLDAGWSDGRVADVLGGNARRLLRALRPGAPGAQV